MKSRFVLSPSELQQVAEIKKGFSIEEIYKVRHFRWIVELMLIDEVAYYIETGIGYVNPSEFSFYQYDPFKWDSDSSLAYKVNRVTNWFKNWIKLKYQEELYWFKLQLYGLNRKIPSIEELENRVRPQADWIDDVLSVKGGEIA